MKTKITTTIVALLLVLSMLLGACTSAPAATATVAPTVAATAAPTEAPTPAPTPRETLTLNYMGGAVVEGIAKDQWWTKKLESDIGVILNISAYSDEAYNTALAAGTLPDICELDDCETNAPNAINAGQVVNFDDYKALLPNVYAQYPEGALQYMRDTMGGGTKLYTLPDGPCTTGATDSGIEYGIRLAWDYFMEYVDANGQPQLNDIEDFLPVVKWMLDKHPTNADGQKNYGFSEFPSWDGGYYPCIVGFATEMWGIDDVLYPVLINQNDLSYSLIWDDNGPYKRMLKFWFTANQMGLLDPDIGTSDWAGFRAKADAHRTLACFQGWGTAGQFMKLVPFKNMKTTVYHGAWPLGNSTGSVRLWVNKTNGDQYITRSMEFINYMVDYDNAWYIKYGPQGEYWDLNADGKPYITELGDKMGKDATLQLTEGGNPGTQDPMGVLGYWRFYNPSQIHPKYGVMFSTAGWALRDGYVKAPEQVTWEAWAKKNYNVDPVAGGVLSDSRLLDGVNGFAPLIFSAPQSDALKEFQTKMSNVYQSWYEMIYAKDQATFDSLWTATQATLQGMWKDSGLDAAALVKLYTDQMEANNKYIK